MPHAGGEEWGCPKVQVQIHVFRLTELGADQLLTHSLNTALSSVCLSPRPVDEETGKPSSRCQEAFPLDRPGDVEHASKLPCLIKPETKTHKIRNMSVQIVALRRKKRHPCEDGQSCTMCGSFVAIAVIPELLLLHRGHFALYDLVQHPLRTTACKDVGPAGFLFQT